MLQNKIQTALQNAKNRGEEDGGFTLIELLVVILIIGILAAIALPTFLGQSDKAKDSSAKSDARNVVSMIESCNSTTQDYTTCMSKTALTSATAPSTGGIDGLQDGAAGAPAKGQVKVVSATTSGYVIAAKSPSDKNFYLITKTETGSARTCGETYGATAATGTSSGACNGNKW